MSLERIKAAMGRGGEKLDCEIWASRDYPDFCDSHITSGSYLSDGQELTEEEINYIHDEHSDYVYELAHDHYF